MHFCFGLALLFLIYYFCCSLIPLMWSCRLVLHVLSLCLALLLLSGTYAFLSGTFNLVWQFCFCLALLFWSSNFLVQFLCLKYFLMFLCRAGITYTVLVRYFCFALATFLLVSTQVLFWSQYFCIWVSEIIQCQWNSI